MQGISELSRLKAEGRQGILYQDVYVSLFCSAIKLC